MEDGIFKQRGHKGEIRLSRIQQDVNSINARETDCIPTVIKTKLGRIMIYYSPSVFHMSYSRFYVVGLELPFDIHVVYNLGE